MEESFTPMTLDLPIDGVRYHVRLAGSGPAIVLLHGFTGSGASWESLTAMLEREYRVIAVDLLGHGRTDAPHDLLRYRVEHAVADLVALIDALGVDDFALLGYSMGGRLALHLALAEPSRVRALILESASPGIAGPDERAARIRADEELADAIEREGIDAFVTRWEALALFASQLNPSLAVRGRLRTQRLANSPTGLANSLRGMGAGVPPALYDRLGELSMPALLIAGALDEKYRRLANTMQARMPHAETAIVPGAGHTVHLEQPAAFDEVVRTFLQAHYAGSDRGASPSFGSYE
jgi:2-succinyl-6-hydroxy-2,4-cyclohexadiene-1-carboxylate synthase